MGEENNNQKALSAEDIARALMIVHMGLALHAFHENAVSAKELAFGSVEILAGMGEQIDKELEIICNSCSGVEIALQQALDAAQRMATAMRVELEMEGK